MKLTLGKVVFPMVAAYVKSDCYIPSDFSSGLFFIKKFRNVEIIIFEFFNISENNIISVKLAQVLLR
jgi:hypothetical protein